RIIVETKCAQPLHIGNTEAWTDMDPGFISPAAALNFRPRLRGKQRNGLIRLAAHCHVTIQFAQCSAWGYRWMRADRNFHCPTIEFGEPLSRNAQLGLRAPPEK